MRCPKIWIAILGVLLTSAASSYIWAQDPGWPRQIVKPGGNLIVYQPQVDDWQNYTHIRWRMAFQLTPAGGKQIAGALTAEATTQVDTGSQMVFMYNINVLNTYFPGQDPATFAQLGQLVRSFMPPTVNISLERVVAYMPKPESESVRTVALKNDPPRIFVAYTPAILLGVDGEPVLADIPKTNVKFVVNTQWPLFIDGSNSQHYLLVDKIWLSSGDLHGPWSRVTTLPYAFSTMPYSPQFADVWKQIPPRPVSDAIVPQVIYSTVPSDVILFNGQPSYTAIPETRLLYANNTDSPVFLYSPTQTYYYLT